MNATEDETFEPVDFSNVHLGDRVRFLTNENGYDGRGLYERTGTVVKVTEKTVRVDCNSLADGKFGNAVLRRADWGPRNVHKAVAEQPVPLTSADLPEGTRVAHLDGRLGTAMGCWTGRVTNTEHENYGREYTGVKWDADEKTPWGLTERPFVDELGVVQTPPVDVPDRGRIVNDVPQCVHGNAPRPDVTGNPIGACRSSRGTEDFGVFNDEGCIYVYGCAVNVANEAVKESADSDWITWSKLCTEHAEQPAGTCEVCFTA